MPVTTIDKNTTTSAQPGQTTLTANNDQITIGVEAWDTLSMQIPAGLTGTMTYTGSIDGTNFVGLIGLNAGGVLSTGASSGSDVNPAVLRTFDVTGLLFFRAQITAFGSGTAVLTWLLSKGPMSPTFLSVPQIIPGVGVTNLGKAEDAAHASGDTGVFILGVRNDAQATFTNLDLDYSPLKVNQNGALSVVVELPALQASLGLTKFRLVAAGTTNATSIKGASGSVASVLVANTAAAAKFVKLYSKATAPTVGTDTPTDVLQVPANSTILFNYTAGLPFVAGIALAITNLAPDADATAVTAGDVILSMVYR